MDELLDWPWKRFERFYEAAKKRDLVETLERRKDGMISALWSNSNYDDEKNTRQNAIADIEERCEEAVEIILTGIDPSEVPEEEVDDQYGFFAAGERGLSKILAPRDDEGTVRDNIDYMQYTDQQ